ncbi:hypothetical protein G7Y79_00019g046740 [Physcia stellaris]|nr:hypothetical protein G7Y79_00019g046740 [Physcia stellaris]
MKSITDPPPEDDTYNIFIWTVIEPCMGVICACLPTLGPLFQGGHSLETMIGTLRSYLRLGSQSKTSINQDKGFKPFESPADHAAKSYPDDAFILTSIKGRRSEDLESRNSTDAGIYVGTKVSRSESERQAPGI